MSKRFRTILTSSIAVSLLYRLIRGYSRTFRLEVENERAWMDHVESGGAAIICCWHQQFFSAIRHFRTYRHYRPSLMISRSFDGEIIAGVASRTGWDVVRGSSSRGGRDALTEMVEKLRQKKVAAHIVDGPRGPAGKVKAGIIRLAQLGGAVIAPFYARADRAWFFNSWDRFMIPKPFARVTLRFGDLFEVPRISSPEEFEQHRFFLEKDMQQGLIYP
ncbi:MAG: hypothetical protein BWZ01_02467 [Deltaproteobacteria bacterium ADurb.BinA179]|jgi:hypothetical protein|nr:lysophospholipid acyltransferase family protein [Bacteriovoracaceae bacterium]OPZ25496.1 MAG: hypothetical protein BWZ01_02467 [Deltaproteobacteria bacterium ADurb.BinA179]HNR52081.1 lysophospholipid acyltransferase family protein [Deltaproteobacteria bacterium]HRR19830.1 lysophospholipid acyltransferase family protein [Desulfomonilia bacterium]HNU74279.1 lysophospholipid acyltransferase family protein [Deltaproteobacteria bacterium]